MKSKIYTLVLLACLIQLVSCKKDARPVVNTPKQQSLEQGLINFSINGQLIPATIDTTQNKITVVVPRTANFQSLTVNFTLASQVNATINNTSASSGATIDFTKPVVLKVASSDQKRSTSFQVNAETDLQYFGITGAIISENSLSRDYNFYFDQFDGSAYEAINCGPASTTMAIKWADSNFSKKPVDARNAIMPQGGWWTTSNIIAYLQQDGLSYTTDTLGDVPSVIKTRIDNNNAVILCLDMFSVSFNQLDYEHTDKFYATNAPGWGHFIMIKGYIQTDSNFYLEAYDPYSGGLTYSVITNGQLKGINRYYESNDIFRATQIWWPYYIALAARGKEVLNSGKLSINSTSKPIPVAFGK